MMEYLNPVGALKEHMEFGCVDSRGVCPEDYDDVFIVPPESALAAATPRAVRCPMDQILLIRETVIFLFGYCARRAGQENTEASCQNPFHLIFSPNVTGERTARPPRVRRTLHPLVGFSISIFLVFHLLWFRNVGCDSEEWDAQEGSEHDHGDNR